MIPRRVADAAMTALVCLMIAGVFVASLVPEGPGRWDGPELALAVVVGTMLPALAVALLARRGS